MDLCLQFRATACVDLEPRLLHREADDEQIPTPHLEDTWPPRKFSCSTSADGRQCAWIPCPYDDAYLNTQACQHPESQADVFLYCQSI